MTDEPKDITRLDVSPADLEAQPTAQSGSDWKVLGEIDTPGATGVLGHTTAASGASTGVHGVTDSSDDFAMAVRGDVYSGSATGVMGWTRAPGKAGAPTTAVYGYADATSPTETMGVVGSNQNDHVGALAVGGVAGSSYETFTSRSYGVKGVTHATGTDSAGVYGEAVSSTGITHGVYGTASNSDGYGVFTPDDARADGAVHAGDGFRGNVGSSVYRSSETDVGGGATKTLFFDTEVADERSEYTSGSGTFSPAFDGTYAVDLSVAVKTGSLNGGESFVLQLLENSTPVATSGVSVPSGPGRVSLSISKTLFELQTTDDLTVEFDNSLQSASNDVTLLSGRDKTYLTVRQVA